MVDVPVAFFIFNRPETTSRVFDEIRRARPPMLLVTGDGPRAAHPKDIELCRQARSVIDVDWDCELRTNYADLNLGCRARVSSGLDWVFTEVSEAIVLEDDCLPARSFFPYCEELLKHYRGDHRVMCVSGNNFQFGRTRGSASYYFSRYSHIWGWATWGRAWKHYADALAQWPTLRGDHFLESLLRNPRSVRYWTGIFDMMFAGAIDTWDYVWLLACWVNGGLTALPNRNLVSNIGFGGSGTHSRGRSTLAAIPTRDFVYPLSHPADVLVDVDADEYTFATVFEMGRGRRLTNAARRWLS